MITAIILAVLLVLAVLATAPALTDVEYQGTGHRILYSNTGSAIAAKDVVVLASGTTGKIGIAVADIAATTGTGQVELRGEWQLPKTTGQAYTVGQLVYWTTSTSKVTSVATSTNTRAGRITQAAASAATTCRVLINEP